MLYKSSLKKKGVQYYKDYDHCVYQHEIQIFIPLVFASNCDIIEADLTDDYV